MAGAMDIIQKPLLDCPCTNIFRFFLLAFEKLMRSANRKLLYPILQPIGNFGTLVSAKAAEAELLYQYFVRTPFHIAWEPMT